MPTQSLMTLHPSLPLSLTTCRRIKLLVSFEVVCMCRSRVAYYGVFDGHGGDKASKYTAEHLHQNIRSLLPKGVPTLPPPSLSVFA